MASAARPEIKNVRRRKFLMAGGAATLAGCASAPNGTRSAVTILRAKNYDLDLVDILRRGLRECGLDALGKTVLIKPNFVEFSRETAINTNPLLVAAAVVAFQQLGAASVTVAEGPGHRRDTIGLAEQAGFRDAVEGFDARFVDLNRDDVQPVEGFGGTIYLPATTFGADLIVSMPKLKTHHWAGATLSMKNFFGVVPGALYGWPKNMLHNYGIPQSIVELNRIYKNTFSIVDGIVGMEGNGPIQGTPKHAGVIVMGSDLVAVDATCCRIMGIDPAKIAYLKLATHLGQSAGEMIDQRGEHISAVRTDFALMERWQHIRLG